MVIFVLSSDDAEIFRDYRPAQGGAPADAALATTIAQNGVAECNAAELSFSAMALSAAEEIKEFGKRTSDSNRERLRALSREDLANRISALRDSLLDGLRQFEGFYWYTVGVTHEGERAWGQSPAMNAEVAAEIWKQTKRHFLSMRKGWQEVEKMGEPDIDALVEYSCKVLTELAVRADAEYRAYKETAFLLRSPQNVKRLGQALAEASSGKLPVFETAEKAIKSLRAK